MSPITSTIFVAASSVSFKYRITIPLLRRELCGPKVGVSGDGALGPLPGGWGPDPGEFKISVPLNLGLCRLSQCAKG
jgi:hypothetical protein